MPSVKLLSYTPNPEKTVAAAARLCYSNSGADKRFEGMTDEKASSYVARHRIASYSVQSQRYVRRGSFDFIVPPNISSDEEALAEYNKIMDSCAESYQKITEILQKKEAARLVSEGKSEEEAWKAAEKTAIEDARFVLPNACDTKMVVTMNVRSLHNFFRLRCCNRAQWEIRSVADQMLALCREVAPNLFANAGPGCVSEGRCTEGKMTCGKPRTELIMK